MAGVLEPFGIHHANTLFGSTLIAFQMPSRLASTEMASTMPASISRSGFSMSTRRGKRGNAYCPSHHASP